MKYRGTMGTTIIEELRRLESDLTKAHSLDFYLYFSSKNIATEAARQLSGEGFATGVRLGADEKNWLCLATKRMIPDESALNSLGTSFENLAESYQGEFDGWESEVMKGEGSSNTHGPTTAST
jgi:hypothetical protein